MHFDTSPLLQVQYEFGLKKKRIRSFTIILRGDNYIITYYSSI